MAEQSDEFYTGYLPQAPAGIARWNRAWVVVLFVLAVAVASTLVQLQRPFSKAAYEFGVVRELEGVIRLQPVPTLEVRRPGPVSQALLPPGELEEVPAPVSRYLLVNPFKAGADVAEYEGQRVRIRGSLLYRGEQTMLEILPEQIEQIGDAPTGAGERSYGSHTLAGRIVDSKCYLGIMKPGASKPHRGCAVRCISGGIPPLFLVEAQSGEQRKMLLVGAEGQAVNQQVLDYVAEPVQIHGEVVRVDDLWILKADPKAFQRL